MKVELDQYKNPGVYTIENNINKKIYVGGTTRSVGLRLHEHYTFLKNRIHKNPHLQRSWNKYGKEAFSFDLLDEYDLDYVFYMEQYWINMLSPEYNILNNTVDHIKALSEAKYRKVYMYTLNSDNPLGVFDAVTAASLATGAKHIGACCNGNRSSSGGYRWAYEGNLPVKHRPQKKVKCTIEGKEYPSIYKAAKDIGVSKQYLVAIHKKKISTTRKIEFHES